MLPCRFNVKACSKGMGSPTLCGEAVKGLSWQSWVGAPSPGCLPECTVVPARLAGGWGVALLPVCVTLRS